MSFTIATIAAVGLGAAKGISGFIKNKKAKKEQKEAKRKHAERMKAYENLDTSNPYAGLKNEMEGMENTFEDLTVNTQQAEFERDAAAQSQANVMSSMQEAGGFDAGNIQALVAGGAQAARQASASIGQQEAQNKLAERQQASANQEMERRGAMEVQALKGQGKMHSQQMEMAKQEALMGMTQGQLQSAQADKAAGNQMMMDGITSAIGAFAMKDPKAKAALSKRKKRKTTKKKK